MRLVGIQIDLKPLNRRHNDLMSLIKLFFTKQEISISSTELNDIVELCRKITWHGNIRELYQYLKAACAVSKVQKQSIYNCLVLLLKPKEFKVVTYNSAQKVSNH